MSLMWKSRACTHSLARSLRAYHNARSAYRQQTANDILYIIITRKPLRDRFRGVAFTALNAYSVQREEKEWWRKRGLAQRNAGRQTLTCLYVCLLFAFKCLHRCVWVCGIMELVFLVAFMHTYMAWNAQKWVKESERVSEQSVHSHMNYAKAIILIAIPPSSRWKIDPISECILLYLLRSIYACICTLNEADKFFGGTYRNDQSSLSPSLHLPLLWKLAFLQSTHAHKQWKTLIH